MDKIARVRQEIKQLRREVDDHNYYLDNPEQALGYGLALDDIGQFLDTLSEEPDKSLEEAARRYAIPTYMKDVDENFLDEYPYDPVAEKAFIAGAEWHKSQMLKDAMEGEVYDYGGGSFGLIARWLDMPNEPVFKGGEKVRIVVLKAEEE